jgi:hypothetical protein
MIPSLTACSMTRTSTARLFLTVDRLECSAIQPCTTRSTAPLVIMRSGKWPSAGTILFRHPARYGSRVLPSRPRSASGMTESPESASVIVAVSGSIPAWAIRRMAAIQSSAACRIGRSSCVCGVAYALALSAVILPGGSPADSVDLVAYLAR